MTQPNCICLVFDRLGAGALGAYGNTWLETPNFDRLASESFLFDQALVDSPRLDQLYRAWWSAAPAALPEQYATDFSLPRHFALGGYRTTILADRPELLTDGPADAFADRILIAPTEMSNGIDDPHRPPGRRAAAKAKRHCNTAAAADETQVFRLLAAAGDRLERLAPEPFFLWIHAATLDGPWDAPQEFRLRHVEEGDPPPGDSARPPNRMLPADFDPDEVLPARCAYAGQVGLVDLCLGGFLDLLGDLRLADRTVLAVLGARGFPLGEHRRLGPCDEPLYSELVHVPWMLRLPGRQGAMFRTSELVQPADLPATLCDACGMDADRWPFDVRSLLPRVRDQASAARDRLCLIGPGGDRAIRTPVWHLRISPAGDRELFRKPDDRWERNEVANRAADVVESLQAALAEYDDAVRHGDAALLRPLPAELVEAMD